MIKTRYLLPCHCGANVPVDIGQAGETVRCSCGATVDVPAMRQLRQLPPAVPAAAEPRRSWGPRQRVMLLGCVIALLAAAVGATLWLDRPAAPAAAMAAAMAQLDAQMETVTPLQSWELWNQQMLGDGLVQYDSPARVAYRKQYQTHRRWTMLALGVAGFGLLTLLAAVASSRRFAGSRPREAALPDRDRDR